jgi:uncharacterized metal-binding protein
MLPLHCLARQSAKRLGLTTAKCFTISAIICLSNNEQIRNPKSEIRNRTMPSGKTHDAITFILAVPTFVGVWQYSQNWVLAAWVTGAFLFGGLMFGPDLDTQSVQYTRWGIFRFLWFPYQFVFAHRSRWSHGLIFGTAIRVIYFVGAVTVAAMIVSYLGATASGGEFPGAMKIMQTWQFIGDYTRANIGENAIWAVLIGLWWGAASHTLTDIAGTFFKTGKVKEFL